MPASPLATVITAFKFLFLGDAASKTLILALTATLLEIDTEKPVLVLEGLLNDEVDLNLLLCQMHVPILLNAVSNAPPHSSKSLGSLIRHLKATEVPHTNYLNPLMPFRAAVVVWPGPKDNTAKLLDSLNNPETELTRKGFEYFLDWVGKTLFATQNTSVSSVEEDKKTEKLIMKAKVDAKEQIETHETE